MTKPIDTLIKAFADIGASFGYIGNVSRYGDDRSWRIFTKLSTRPAASACDVSFHLNSPDDIDLAAVTDWLERQRAKVNAGSLYRVNPSGWYKP